MFYKSNTQKIKAMYFFKRYKLNFGKYCHSKCTKGNRLFEVKLVFYKESQYFSELLVFQLLGFVY